MKLTQLKSFFVKALGGDRATEVNDQMAYRSSESTITIDTMELVDGELEKILKAAKALPQPDERLVRKIEGLMKFSANPTGLPVVRLERLEHALRDYIKPTPHKYLFKQAFDGEMVPYFVKGISYHDATKSSPAHVNMETSAIRHERGIGKTVVFHSSDLHGGKTISEVLASEDFYLETEAGYDKWRKELDQFNAIYNKTGLQYSAKGRSLGDSWGSRVTEMVREGIPARVVMDYFGDEIDEDTGRRGRRVTEEEGLVDASYWLKKDEDEGESVAAPIHPYVQVFDFQNHDHVLIHVNSLTPYQYKTDLGSKLVLPGEVKELVGILIEGAAAVMQDIISGKTGGVVVAATGAPGTGKTLTAEIYAEHIKRPLYAVQCSQLGTDEEKLEKKLNMVLTRASRWGAILLVDEADVYVRARGDDIQQNAIVGVFLRLLEYYRGVLFLTSNRDTMIDDAIMSRCLAHLRYELPSPDDLRAIWVVLASNYRVVLSAAEIKECATVLPGISGRNVKNLIKLAMAVAAKRKERVTPKIIKEVSRFVSLASNPK